MIKTNIDPKFIKYVLVMKYCGYHSCNYEFISQLAHEFAGKKEAIGYSTLEHAIHFDSEEEAAKVLATQPEWVQKGHEIRPFTKIGTYCAVGI